MLLEPEKFENAGWVFIFVWTENLLKTGLFENDGAAILT